MIDTLNNYADLINIALLGTIIGFLFHIARVSRTAIIDKYEAQADALQQRVTLLEAQEDTTRRNHQAAISLLERQLTFYQSISEMPEDKRIIAVKAEYEQKLAELERELSSRELEGEEAKSILVSLENAAREVSKEPSPTYKAAMHVLQDIVGTTMKMYIH